MHLALLIHHLPLAALGGEVESPEGSGSGVGVGVLSIGSIALGWIGLFALWWFVFRDKGRARRRKRDDPPR